MDKIKLLLGCALVGVAVALTYFLFESGLSHSITYVWDTVFDSGTVRLWVVPLCLVLSLVFFGLQHMLDPKSEGHEEHSLGGEPINPTLRNLGIVLLLGYFSLLSGASLGPEAVLVPASVIIGGYFGSKLFKKNEMAMKALTAAAIMALMAAFFHSFFVGLISVLFVSKQAKTKLTPQLLIIAVVSSASSFLVLNAIDPANQYLNLPHLTWRVAIIDILSGVVLIVSGYLSTFALKHTHSAFVVFRSKTKFTAWWLLAIVAGVGLSLLYLMGGPLVEFTGNESIAPLVADSTNLGLFGLLAIFITKILAIGWSRAMGYRGGLIFPMIFIASTLVVLSQLVFHDSNFGVGLVAAMAGILAAEKKAKVLL